MKNEEKEKAICPKCGSTRTIKYGKQNKIQKFKCKEDGCGHYFLNRKREGYTLKEKKFFSMLINFLRDSSETGIKIQEAISNINSNIDIKEISKFRLYQMKSIFKRKRSKYDNNGTLRCYNPRLLICEDHNSIVMYRFSNRTWEDGDHRKILIIDSDENKNVEYGTISEIYL